MHTPSDHPQPEGHASRPARPHRTAAEFPIRSLKWTAEAVRALGVRTDVPTAGAILGGLCRDEAYRAVKRGTFPVPVIKVGRRLVVPVQPILDLLGLGEPVGGDNAA